MMYYISAMTYEFALIISQWKYDNEYSIYSFEQSQETIAELLTIILLAQTKTTTWQDISVKGNLLEFQQNILVIQMIEWTLGQVCALYYAVKVWDTILFFVA